MTVFRYSNVNFDTVFDTKILKLLQCKLSKSSAPFRHLEKVTYLHFQWVVCIG